MIASAKAMIPAALVCAVGFGAISGDLFFPSTLFVGAAIAIFLRQRLDVDMIGQIIVALFTAALAYTWFFIINTPPVAYNPTRLGPLAGTFAATFFTTAVGRLYFREPYYSDRGTAALLILGILATGSARLDFSYTIFAVIAFPLTIYGMARGAPHRPKFFTLTGMRRLLLLSAIAVSTVLATSSIVSLPLLYERAMAAWLKNQWGDKSSFSSNMELGALNDLLLSNTAVLRVIPPHRETPVPTHLRGAVHNRYEYQRWFFSAPSRTDQLPATGSKADLRQSIRIQHLNDKDKNYFVPLRAGSFSSADGETTVDAAGIVRPFETVYATQNDFSASGSLIPQPIPPVDRDLLISEEVRVAVESVSRKLRGNASTPTDILKSLQAGLRSNYRYSLVVTPDRRVDPLAYFLLTGREGHCEYFASAFALLARASGIPTRVISGYLVTEWNPVGNWYVVRERNAHSWVEAWVDGRWQTWDPTPPVELAEHTSLQSGPLAALFDYLAYQFARGLERLASLTRTQLAIALSVLLGTWVAVRLFRRLRRRRTRKLPSVLDYRNPPPEYLDFLKRLSRKGTELREGETLDDFADRIDASDESLSAAAGLIRRFAAWRFGKIGDMESLLIAFRHWPSNPPEPDSKTNQTT